jgi:hypothetical protein
MPELLTRLVRAAVGLTAQLRFPSDESVQLPEWDGICNVDNGTEHIPSGNSVWEIGTQRQGIKAKADEEYRKRTAKPLGLDRKKTTFVFVTPRHWTKKGEWARARRAEKKWADVRAYDADDLVHWSFIPLSDTGSPSPLGSGRQGSSSSMRPGRKGRYRPNGH